MIGGYAQYLCRVFLLAGLAVGLPGALCADPFSLTGSWNYQESGGDVEDTWQFNQSYSLAGAKSLAASSDLSASFRYTKSSRRAGEDSEVMSPSATLGVRNDLFSLNFSGTQTQRQTGSGPELTSQSWDVTGFSLLEDLPRLRLNYGQSFSRDDENPRRQDTESDYFSASLDYTWTVFDFYYDYRIDSSTNNLATSTTESERHFGKIEYSDSFFRGKVGVNLSQQYQTSDSETDSEAATGETVFIPINLAQTLVGQDDTPLTSVLTANAALNDGDRFTPTGVEIAQPAIDDQNLGMQTDFQPVNQMRVYLDRDISPAVQGLLSWALYTSENNLDWDLVSGAPPVRYEQEDNRTVVVVDVPGPALLERYLKLVVSPGGLAPEPVYVTELAAGNAVLATGNQVIASSNYTSYQTRGGITYAPLDAWSFAYNLSYDKNEPDPGLASTRLNQALSARYAPTADFSLAASVSENRDETESREERLNRSYSLSAQQQLWETMNLSASYSHSEGYEDSVRTSESDSLNGFLNAQLFPDLSASLNLNWSQSENPREDTQSESYGWRLHTTARLTARLDANAYYDYTNSTRDAQEADDDATTRYGLSLNFRPSDILSFYGSLNRNPDEKETAFSGSASWRMTPKLQASVNTSQELEQGDSESYSASLSWLVSSHFSARSSAGYQVADGSEAWSWRVNLNATF